MEKRNSTALVQKAIAAFLICDALTSASASMLTVRWNGRSAPQCQELVQEFLGELRSVATDQTITAEAIPNENLLDKKQNLLSLTCQSGDRLEISTSSTNGDKKYVFRYLKMAKAFEPDDWVVFQSEYLATLPEQEEQKRLALKDLGVTQPISAIEKDPALKVLAKTEAQEQIEEKSLLGKWWFWTFVAAAAGSGTYLLLHGPRSPSTTTIQVR